MVRLGMDVEVVESVGKQLRQQGQQVASLVRAVDALVDTADGQWWGARGRDFVHQWRTVHRRALLQVAGSVDGLARTALDNVQDQRRGSGYGILSLSLGELLGRGQDRSTIYRDLPFAVDPYTGRITHLDGTPVASGSTEWSWAHSALDKRGAFDLGIIQGDGQFKAFDYLAEGQGSVDLGIDGLKVTGAAAASALLFSATGGLHSGGNSLTAEAKAGAWSNGSGRAAVGPSGLAASARGEAMVGVEASAGGRLEGVAGTSVSGRATGIIGFGVSGAGTVDVGWDGVTVKGGLKGAFILGAGAEGEIHVDPVEALNSVGSWSGNEHLGDEVRANADALAQNAAGAAYGTANAVYHSAQEISGDVGAKIDQLIHWNPRW